MDTNVLKTTTMKHVLITVIFFLWSFSSIASDSTIIFRQIEYSDIFATAKKENKAVMLYFHFDGCGACLEMEKTAFKDERVYDYYNSNFVNYEINTRKGNGIEINKLYNIQLHPTFLFLDDSGNEIHRIVGVYNPEEFLKQADNTVKSKKTLTNYKILYKEGNRDSEFLFEYTYMLRDAFELDSIVVNQYLDAIDSQDYIREKNLKYIYEFCIHNFKIFIPFNNPRFDFLIQNKDLFYEYFDQDQVDIRIVWILNNAIYNAIEEKNETSFNYTIEFLKEYDTGKQYLYKEMDGRVTGMITSKNLVLLSMVNFYEKMGETTKYTETLEQYISKIWNDAIALNYYAWGAYERSNDDATKKINTAIKCSIRSIELKNNYENNDTYAWLLYKSGEKQNAFKQAIKAIEIAKENDRDYSETQKLIDLINAE